MAAPIDLLDADLDALSGYYGDLDGSEILLELAPISQPPYLVAGLGLAIAMLCGLACFDQGGAHGCYIIHNTTVDLSVARIISTLKMWQHVPSGEHRPTCSFLTAPCVTAAITTTGTTHST